MYRTIFNITTVKIRLYSLVYEYIVIQVKTTAFLARVKKYGSKWFTFWPTLYSKFATQNSVLYYYFIWIHM